MTEETKSLAGKAHGQPQGSPELLSLRQLIGLMVISSLPLLAVSIYTSLISGSLSVVALFLHTGVSLAINTTTYFLLGVIARSNVFQFPYGTGKLENFAGFLNGLGVLILAATIFYRGMLRLSAPTVKVSLGIAQIAFLVGVLRMICIVWWLARMTRNNPNPSPLLHAYYINCTASLWYTLGLLVAMLSGWLLSYRWGDGFSLTVDLLVAAYFSAYVAWTGIRVLRSNFPSLVDLPLPESDQMKILPVLARHSEEYSGLGRVLTRRSGGQRRVEIELFFPPETTAMQIESLRQAMVDELQQGMGQVEFSLMARTRDQEPASPGHSPSGG